VDPFLVASEFPDLSLSESISSRSSLLQLFPKPLFRPRTKTYSPQKKLGDRMDAVVVGVYIVLIYAVAGFGMLGLYSARGAGTGELVQNSGQPNCGRERRG
jgi:hypothetical protein